MIHWALPESLELELILSYGLIVLEKNPAMQLHTEQQLYINHFFFIPLSTH